ncbi:MAG: hypothetical protein J7L31_03915 [Thermoplasmata archaeon]|nr:hypothetical protein [Thermoplasmata archaeon]
MFRKAIIVLCIGVLLLLPAHGFFGEEKEKPFYTPIKMSRERMPIPVKAEMAGKVEMSMMAMPSSIPVANTENTEMHPSVETDGDGTLFAAYTLQMDILNANIMYIYSQDNGATWQEGGYFNLEGAYDYPAIDYWGSGGTFIGTFAPDPSDCDGAAQYVLRVDDVTDPTTWSLVYWDWTDYNQRDRESPDIAGYSDVGDATWWYGVIADTGSSDYADSAGEHIPIFNWPDYTSDSSGWIWWWDSFPNSAHACIDIDRSNGVLYAAWDQYNESRPDYGRDILLAIADVHNWWQEIWEINWSYLGGSEDNTYPDVAAENGYIYVVCQADITIPGKQDIICFYSHDGGKTWETSTIAADPAKDEVYPSIVAYGEGATCTFLIDGDIYVSHTTDGGVTWSEAKKVNDEDGSVYNGYRTLKLATAGNIMWTDMRNGNADVYYDSVGYPPTPIITIKDIAGGFGVKATIANTGTADAENVEWSITLDGLVFMGKEKSGNVNIAAGSEVTIKSGLVFGIGPVSITAKAGGATKTASGMAVGPFILGVG